MKKSKVLSALGLALVGLSYVIDDMLRETENEEMKEEIKKEIENDLSKEESNNEEESE